MRIFILVLILMVAALVLLTQSAFAVDQTQYAVVTRFGQIQRVIRAPGLQFKTPFVEEVLRYDNRLLHIDVPAALMQDKDKQQLEIDAYVRYRITDPEKFLKTLQSEVNAQNRIGNIVTSELRQVVAVSDRTDIIGGVATTQPDGLVTVEAKKTPGGIDTREAITRQVLTAVNNDVQSAQNDYGIQVVDVRIKAADFPTTVEQSVFTRMKTERAVQAQRLRAQGTQENLTITADVDKQVTVINATAQSTANQLMGEGEAQAIDIYASALQQDPEFYAFQRSLQAYKVSLSQNTTLMLSSKDDLFKYLASPLALTGTAPALTPKP